MSNPRIDMHSWTLARHRRFSGARWEPRANARSTALALIPMDDWCGSVPQPHRRETGCVIMLCGAVWPRPFATTQDNASKMRFTRVPRPFNGRHIYRPNVDSFNTLYTTGSGALSMSKCGHSSACRITPGKACTASPSVARWTISARAYSHLMRFCLKAKTLCRWALLTHGGRDRNALQHGHRTEPFNDFHLCCVTYEERSGKPQRIH